MNSRSSRLSLRAHLMPRSEREIERLEAWATRTAFVATLRDATPARSLLQGDGSSTMTDDEGDSLGGRLGPLRPGRQLGRRAGGEARRPALSRLDPRPRQARVGAEGGAGRPERAADEGRPAHRHHPRRAAAGVCQGACPAAGQCARHGLDLRAPAHGDGVGAGLAGQVRQVRQGGLVRRVAGPGPSRDAARRHARSRPSCSIPTWPRRSKPISTS